MNAKDFNKVVKNRCDSIKQTLLDKGKEYATSEDRFHNFNKAAQRRGISAFRALDGMMLKHEVSVDDLIGFAEKTPERLTHELINEKLGDFINYLILLEGMLREAVCCWDIPPIGEAKDE
jgi:hypothetical protein